MRNLGAMTGLITMAHHIAGGAGAYLGARIFDATGSYDRAFLMVLTASIVAAVATLGLRRKT